MRRLVIALACLGAACAPGGLPPGGAGGLGTFFNHTPDFPGYAWTYRGKPVDTRNVMNTIAGPAHCGWQAATIMHLPWPVGTTPASSAAAREYVRDPTRVMPQGNLRGSLDLHATLPADAVATGYRYETVEVYVAPSDEWSVYLVGPNAVERWPRSEPMTLCA